MNQLKQFFVAYSKELPIEYQYIIDYQIKSLVEEIDAIRRANRRQYRLSEKFGEAYAQVVDRYPKKDYICHVFEARRKVIERSIMATPETCKAVDNFINIITSEVNNNRGSLKYPPINLDLPVHKTESWRNRPKDVIKKGARRHHKLEFV